MTFSTPYLTKHASFSLELVASFTVLEIPSSVSSVPVHSSYIPTYIDSPFTIASFIFCDRAFLSLNCSSAAIHAAGWGHWDSSVPQSFQPNFSKIISFRRLTYIFSQKCQTWIHYLGKEKIFLFSFSLMYQNLKSIVFLFMGWGVKNFLNFRLLKCKFPVFLLISFFHATLKSLSRECIYE